jgi:WD40 repeat protein
MPYNLRRSQLTNFHGNLVSSEADGTIRTWDWQNGRLIQTLEAHDRAVRGLVWAEDYLILGGTDGRLQVWDYKNDQPVFELRDQVRAVWRLASGRDKLAVALLLGDGKHIVELWTLPDIKDRRTKEIARGEEVI